HLRVREKTKPPEAGLGGFEGGASARIRTWSLLIRSQMPYPVWPRLRRAGKYSKDFRNFMSFSLHFSPMLKKIGTMFWKLLKSLGRVLGGWGKSLSRDLGKPAYRARVASWLKFFVLVTAVACLALVGLFGYFSLSLPALDPLERLNSGYITRVTGKDGKLVHEFYIQRRIWMPEEKLPERLKQAVIAV